MKGLDGPLRVAVGGGKGGVGKSVVAANLACAMAELGFRTILVDADLGSANQHTLFGIDRPGITLQALIDRKIETLEEAVTSTPFGRLFLVPGSGAVVGAANVAHGQKLKLIRHIARLDADAIIIDCGAGTSYNVVDLFAAADIKLVVASPQLVSLQNAYAFVKSAVYRSMMARAISPARKELFSTATSRTETERVRGLVDRVAEDDWGFADELARVVDTFEARIVGNQLESVKQKGVLHALSRMMTDFLALEAPVVASLPFSAAIHHSVTKRMPFFAARPASTESAALTALAEQLLELDIYTLRETRNSERPGPPRETRPQTPELLPGPLSRYLRRHERLSVAWPAVVTHLGHRFASMFADVSMSGASFIGSLPAQVGDEVTIAATVQGQTVSLRATVRNVSPTRFGVEFGQSDSTGDQLVALARGLAA